MKKGLTELVFLLDRSGSMQGLEKNTIGGFNSMIKKQKKEKGQALVSTVLFNGQSMVLHDRRPLKKIKLLGKKDYIANGSTALIDAIGSAIHHISTVHQYMRDEDRPEKTMFVILTDGLENASSHYTSDEVKKKIQKRKEKLGWEFLFLGANIDAIETAQDFGIDQDRAVDYYCDSRGTDLVYEVLDETIAAFRSSQPLETRWKTKIEKDYQKRKR